jgi:hypothetical protein
LIPSFINPEIGVFSVEGGFYVTTYKGHTFLWWYTPNASFAQFDYYNNILILVDEYGLTTVA